MIWLAILFVGLGVADLAHAALAERRAPWARSWWFTALFGVVAQGSLALLTLSSMPDAAATAVCALTVLAWRRAHAGELDTLPRAARALATGAVPAAALLAFSGSAGPVTGPLPAWFSTLHVLGIDHTPAQRVLMLLAVLLVNLATGNVVVRDVLVIAGRPSLDRDDTPPLPEPANVWDAPALEPAAAGDEGGELAAVTPDPRDAPGYDPLAPFDRTHPVSDEATDDADEAQPLRGGRILGPMERLLIIGLGSWGNLTAAAIVVAAKGLLRFPELNKASKNGGGRSLDEITEYVLIGTLASILFALGTLALAS